MNNTDNAKQPCRLAKASFILGLLSILVTPIPAIICGHVALSKIKTNPSLSGKTQAITGLILGYLFLLFFILPMFNVIFILGPWWSKPDFKNMDWISVKVTYWMHNEGEVNYRKSKRVFEIQNKSIIDQLKGSMVIKDIKAANSGADDQIVITMKDGKKWQGSIVFKDHISLCLQSKMYYSYRIYLSNRSFYDALLNLTLENERKNNPDAEKRSIILDRNDS